MDKVRERSEEGTWKKGRGMVGPWMRGVRIKDWKIPRQRSQVEVRGNILRFVLPSKRFDNGGLGIVELYWLKDGGLI